MRTMLFLCILSLLFPFSREKPTHYESHNITVDVVGMTCEDAVRVLSEAGYHVVHTAYTTGQAPK